MASAPTAEKAARYILHIYVNKFNRRAGDVLSLQNFLSYFSVSPWRVDDFENGIGYAVANEWLDIVDDHSFRLTKEGFAAA